MKKILALFLFAGFAISLQAQRPKTTFFSEDGHKFWVIMDGSRKNAEPQYRVDNIEMQNDWAQVKIIFENPEIPELEKTIQGVDPDGKPISAIWAIKKNNKGKWILRPSSWGELPGEPASTVQQQEIPAQQNLPEPANTGNPPPTGNDIPAGVSVQTGETGISMEINMQEPAQEINTGINMNVRTDRQTDNQTYGNVNVGSDLPPVPYEEPAPAKNQPVSSECTEAVNHTGFAEMKENISSASFEETKFSIARQMLNGNCLSSSQVKEIMEIFSFEQTRLDFAKTAYLKTVDKNNYYKVNSAFSFESSVEELNEYIQGLR
ncbi:MAG: DUF4476 domain-containing protein [Bacteroidales bacterium]|nr:DUF4476 domain-containing protein [Bacteroidales bacterium]